MVPKIPFALTPSGVLLNLYSENMYGTWRNGSDEQISYTYRAPALTLTVTRVSTGISASFTATVSLPAPGTTVPAGGMPVLISMHQGVSEASANEEGFAVITIDGFSIPVASDNTEHNGAFYTLYPYRDDIPSEQTGVLMAWAWGCSKVLDALFAGLANDLHIDPESAVVTGVSRWGKATLVCGAYDKRFRMVMPSCSGAGGVALFSYVSEGRTYDFSSKGGPDSYTYGRNEPLESLQAPGEQGWFNNRFLAYRTPDELPFDQHLLLTAIRNPNRALFIIGSCISEDWVNAPAMWYAYRKAKPYYDTEGLGDHIAINIHKEGHAVLDEDIRFMAGYFRYLFQNDAQTGDDFDLSRIQTSVFELEQNRDPEMDPF